MELSRDGYDYTVAWYSIAVLTDMGNKYLITIVLLFTFKHIYSVVEGSGAVVLRYIITNDLAGMFEMGQYLHQGCTTSNIHFCEKKIVYKVNCGPSMKIHGYSKMRRGSHLQYSTTQNESSL